MFNNFCRYFFVKSIANLFSEQNGNSITDLTQGFTPSTQNRKILWKSLN